MHLNTQLSPSSDLSSLVARIGDEMYPREDRIATTSGHSSGLGEKRKGLKL